MLSRQVFLKPLRSLKLDYFGKIQLTTTAFLNKIVPSNLKGKSKSSQDWLTRQLNDQYVKKSRYDNYRCRSAYKLLEIDEKYKILKPGLSVIDIGAAPGSWTQVVTRKLKLVSNQDDIKSNGIVIAIDLQNFEPLNGAIILKESNFLDPTVQEKIVTFLPNKKADLIMSDMAPNATGVRDLDVPQILNLVYNALEFSLRTLNKNGAFLCKIWDNNNLAKLIEVMENHFASVKKVKPKACRADSTELYLLAQGYKSYCK